MVVDALSNESAYNVDMKQKYKVNIMEKYDYRQAVIDDIREYINEQDIRVTNENREELETTLNDTLWANDSVTGNASGSYTFNRWKAEEYLCHNLDLLKDACDEFGCELEIESAEWCDVTIRCYLLGECLSSVLDELEEDVDELDDIEE